MQCWLTLLLFYNLFLTGSACVVMTTLVFAELPVCGAAAGPGNTSPTLGPFSSLVKMHICVNTHLQTLSHSTRLFFRLTVFYSCSKSHSHPCGCVSLTPCLCSGIGKEDVTALISPHPFFPAGNSKYQYFHWADSYSSVLHSTTLLLKSICNDPNGWSGLLVTPSTATKWDVTPAKDQLFI